METGGGQGSSPGALLAKRVRVPYNKLDVICFTALVHSQDVSIRIIPSAVLSNWADRLRGKGGPSLNANDRSGNFAGFE